MWFFAPFVLRTSGVKNLIISEIITDTRFKTTHFAWTTLNFDIPYRFCTKDEQSQKLNDLGKPCRNAFWIFGIILTPKCPLSVETTNFSSTSLNFDISNYSFTKYERCKKSNYRGKHRRYASWILGIISPLECLLSVETTNFTSTTLNFDIPDYFCTKDERSENQNYLGKYRRYAFWIIRSISPPECWLCVETTNFAPTTLNFDIPNHLLLRTSEKKRRIILENNGDSRFESWGLYHHRNVRYL